MNDIKLQIPDLNKYTVPQIKEWANNNELKVPSGLNKNLLIEYLTGKIKEKYIDYHKINKDFNDLRSIFEPKYVDDKLDWLVHLHTYGWTVLSIEGWNYNFTDMFMSWFESCSNRFNKNDLNTWTKENMPIMTHGIIKNYFGHTELQWQIRELCCPIFARIWNCKSDELLCSFDGGSFLPATFDYNKSSSFKQWIHVDQNRFSTNFCSVQGIVNFEENTHEDGGLILVENSHTIFEEYMQKHPSEGIIWGPADMTDPLLAEKKLIKICAPAGSIILFDSRTFHCNIYPSGSIFRENGSSRFRMSTYVSMQPRLGASQKELAKRIKIYEKGRMTNHWCYGMWFKETPENPHTYGAINNKPNNIEIAQLNTLRRSLIGY